MQRGVLVLLLSPLLHAHAVEILAGRAAWMFARPRCRIPQLSLAAVDEAAAAYARTALLEEVAKPQRSLPAIAEHVATLEAAAQPSKLKRKLQGDWKLKFASDEAAVTPFTSGAADGPFAVLEEVYHRLLSGDATQSLEVVRKIGPFGNSLQALCGKWRVASGGERKGKGKGKGGDKGGDKGGGGRGGGGRGRGGGLGLGLGLSLASGLDLVLGLGLGLLFFSFILTGILPS